MFGRGFRLGQLYGINIRIDWSWMLIMLLISWNLTTVFGRLHPGWGIGARWGLSIVAAFLFFASVLLHELAHSLIAKAQGLPVQNITLFLFGGVSNIEREPTSPKNEFVMAAAGPFTSLILGVLMILGAVTTTTAVIDLRRIANVLASLSPIGTVFLWLGTINIVLAIFNMIPGFPLDGGRVLRSILWGATHDLHKATRWAARIGQAIAWIMIIVGISMLLGVHIPFFGTGLINGIWLAFIGWFLNNASSQSYQQLEVQEILEGVPVSRIMRTDPPTIEPDCTVSHLINTQVMGTDDQAFPVLEHGSLVGIVTLADVERAPRNTWDTTLISDIMTPNIRLVTVGPELAASEAMETLLQRNVLELPVVRKSPGMGVELVGLLRRTDILRWLQLHSGFPKNRQNIS